MKRYYKIDSDLSLLHAEPCVRQVRAIAQILQRSEASIKPFLKRFYIHSDTETLIKARYKKNKKSEMFVNYLICSKSAKGIVGEISLSIDPIIADTELFYFLDKDATHKGIMTRVISFLQKELLLQSKSERLYTFINKQNEASLAVMGKCGFKTGDEHEGFLFCYQTKDSLEQFLKTKEMLSTQPKPHQDIPCPDAVLHNKLSQRADR